MSKETTQPSGTSTSTLVSICESWALISIMVWISTLITCTTIGYSRLDKSRRLNRSKRLVGIGSCS
ncbi:hypothetical protein Hanom_Chr17g01545971 [Helianthus anomalus]